MANGSIQAGGRLSASSIVRLAGILGFALVTRAAYLAYYRGQDPRYSHLLHDAWVYQKWARALATGENSDGGVFYQAPGYPYLLALVYRVFGTEPIVGYLMQMLAGLLIIVLIFRIAARAFGENEGVAAAAVASLYGVYPFYETKLVSATVALFLACLVVERLQAADTAHRAMSWFVAGLVNGVAVVFRPNLLLLVPLVVGWILLRRETPALQRTGFAVCFVAACAALIAPVTLRNYLVGGEPVMISANAGITFFHGNNPEAEGWFSSPGMSGSISKQRQESRRLAERAEARTMSDAEVSRFWLRQGLEFAAEQPWRYGVLLLRKSFLAFDNYEHGLNYNPQVDSNPVRFLFPVTFALILALAVARLFIGQGLRRAEVPILLLLAVQFATLLAFYCSSRYRLPATGPLLAVAGAGAVFLWRQLRSDWRRAWLAAMAAILAAVLSVVKLPPNGAETYRTRSAIPICDLALAYHKTGKLEKSVAVYREAIDRNPNYVYAHLDMAEVLAQLGSVAEAERSINRAVEVAPGMAAAHFALGNLRLGADRLEQAAASFAEAYRLDPTYAAAGSNLVGTYLTLGRTEQAIDLWREMKRRGLAIHPGLEEWMQRNAGFEM